jgi:acylphosphatase
MKAVSLKIFGRVQGVFFRQRTKEKALELGISGWVRNCEDGSVEVVAEGEENSLQQFIEWCYRGSEKSKVTKVDVCEVEEKKYSDFQIKR